MQAFLEKVCAGKTSSFTNAFAVTTDINTFDFLLTNRTS